MPEVESRLDAAFVLSGSDVVDGGKILIMAELADARRKEIVWADRVSGTTADLLQAQSELIITVTTATSRALLDAEIGQSLVQPRPRLDSSSLLLGGIAMKHGSSVRDFERSRQALDALIDRHARTATPRAWLAKWHVMRIIRGLSDPPRRDTQLALSSRSGTKVRLKWSSTLGTGTELALYSPRVPEPNLQRPSRPGILQDKKRSAPSDENAILLGLGATGSRSGSVVRMFGTSDVAPQVARDIFNRM